MENKGTSVANNTEAPFIETDQGKQDILYLTVSPQGWGLPPSTNMDSPLLDDIGLSKQELETRARNNTYEWFVKQYMEEEGAVCGFYDARTREFNPPQTVNLIAPFQLLAAFDRFQEERFLEMARRCCDWLECNMVEAHPMSLVLGGVLDNIKPHQLWTKYTSDYVILNLSLYERLHEEEYLNRAIRGSKFLLQSQNHNFAPKYDNHLETWISMGWQSFGRVVVAMIALNDQTKDEDWLDRAALWADYGLRLQRSDGSFCLINDTYYSSDIAADEIRAFIRIYWRTERKKYLEAAIKFADWHLKNQLPNGAWPLSVDRWGVTVGEYIGPGDIPNIGVALLMLHIATGDTKYLISVVRSIRYSLTQQLLPGDKPHCDDPNALWGFWSWDPKYDYTMSCDQATHHVRGYWFFLDYFFSLDADTQHTLIEAVKREAPELCA